jgi:hypothetical protein
MSFLNKKKVRNKILKKNYSLVEKGEQRKGKVILKFKKNIQIQIIIFLKGNQLATSSSIILCFHVNFRLYSD